MATSLLFNMPPMQKRKHAAEDEHSQKRSRRNPPSVSAFNQRRGSVPESQLSEDNLKKFERELVQLERDMPKQVDPSVAPPDRGRKRAPSRQTSYSDQKEDTTSQRSSYVSNSFYRFQILDEAQIYVCNEPPPADIRAQMDVIFKREIPEKRRREISGISKKISKSFIKHLRGAQREDDLVEVLYEAFHTMYNDETFYFGRKADWDPSIKPGVQQDLFDREAWGQPNNEADHIVDRPNKRQQGERSFPSLDTSSSTMPPPPALSQSKQNTVKTPRPDFTIGLYQPTISNALIKRGLSDAQADKLLNILQRDGNVCSDPTQHFLDVRFPILVIEGKAYATGKTFFEAQNQAAVSGGCMVNIQQQLTDFFEAVFPNSRGGQTPLAFSICTQGPIIEFWVHYALSKGSARSHYMNIFKYCHGCFQGGLEEFLMDVECLMKWTKTEFLKEVADQLCKLANHAARG